MKQSYRLEDIRVRRYTRLRTMMALVLAASVFAAVHLGLRARMEILAAHVLETAKRIFGAPDFRYYALADGIQEILRRSVRGPLRPRCPDPPSPQLLLFNPPDFRGNSTIRHRT